MLVCGECAVSYFFGDGGVPFMLADLQGQESGETAVLKKDIMKMFTNYNRSLDESGFSRFSTFINWGFASEFNQYSKCQSKLHPASAGVLGWFISRG